MECWVLRGRTASREPRLVEGRSGSPPSLGDRDVHVWTVRLSGDAGRGARFADVLSEVEGRAMARFAFAQDRRRYRLSHVAARTIVGTYLGCEARLVQLEQDAVGKPYIVGADLQCSWAHAGDLAVVGVGRRRALGVDVEPVRTLPDAEALKRTAFTARERAHLEIVDTPSELLRLWTRKEAVLKATGEGLRRAPKDVEVLEPLALRGWRIVDLAPAQGYVGAAVVRDSTERVLTTDFAWTPPACDRPA